MIEFCDNCIVKRSTGTDDEGDEVFSEIYEGECLLQMDSNSRTTRFDGFQFEHEPAIFVPVNDVLFKINDFVEVTTFNGRVINYTIKNWESIRDEEFEELNDTCIWLKDGHEV